MSIAHGLVLLALAVVAHGWSGRVQGHPALLSAIGWILNALVLLMLIMVWVRA